ncbi:MAG: efflux RND transporter periplasmic adaptor subunit [Acidobacteriota bacterium]|nr:efflux RND transporter periplasmic adaptor subunit [Acidobacteriota bacterium]
MPVTNQPVTNEPEVDLIQTQAEEVALPPARKRWPKWAKWAVAIALVAGAAIGVQRWIAGSQAAIRYETVALDRGTIQASVTATGTLNAVINVQVSSQVSGNIKALYADWNSKVTQGQLVALIDPQIFQTQVDQAQAAVNSAHAAVLTAEAQLEKTRADLAGAAAAEKAAESAVARDRANELNAQAQWQRIDELFRDGIVSQTDHDAAKATYDASVAQVAADQAQVDAARQTVQSAQAQVRVAESQLTSARAQERQTRAALQQSQVNLDHTRILAPVDGTVVARRMDVGQTVAATLNPPIIFEIAQDLTKMQVDTNVDESDIGNVRMGQKATFTVDAYPGTMFHGTVTDVRKAPISTQNVVTYDVVIGVSNPELKLFPGMTANARIFTNRVDNALRVPNVVLRLKPSAEVLEQLGLPAPEAGKPHMYVLAEGKLKAVPVTYGLSDGRYTAIVSGDVRAGDRVVSRFITAKTTTGGSSQPGAMRGPRF